MPAGPRCGEETRQVLPILEIRSLTSVKSAADFYDFLSRRGKRLVWLSPTTGPLAAFIPVQFLSLLLVVTSRNWLSDRGSMSIQAHASCCRRCVARQLQPPLTPLHAEARRI